MPLDIDHLKTWIGRSETIEDTVTPVPVAALSATLDRDDPRPRPGDPLPPLWHWLYFLPLHRQSEIGPDGHAKRGGFLPPVPLPRRMWAGSRFAFHRPLRVGEAVRRTSTIADITHKEGRTGPLVFVLVRHEIAGEGGGGPALVEEHDIVYREAPAPGEAAPAPRPASTEAAWRRDIVPDDVLLFRYSALTFNGHRIHYDRRYVTEVEGYPGLIVHGPLIATLLVDLLRRNVEAPLTRFAFRAVRPLFDTASFAVCGAPSDGGDRASVWAQDAEGFLAMQAEAEFGAAGGRP
jgi:3-methylfumaryl-CoA hydratase